MVWSLSLHATTFTDSYQEPRSSPASNRGGRAARARGKRTSKLAEGARTVRRGSKLSIDDSAEEADGMDVDTEGAGKAQKANTRRSGRNR